MQPVGCMGLVVYSEKWDTKKRARRDQIVRFVAPLITPQYPQNHAAMPDRKTAKQAAQPRKAQLHGGHICKTVSLPGGVVTGFGYNIGTIRHIVNRCPSGGSQLFSGDTESRRQDGDMKNHGARTPQPQNGTGSKNHGARTPQPQSGTVSKSHRVRAPQPQDGAGSKNHEVKTPQSQSGAGSKSHGARTP